MCDLTKAYHTIKSGELQMHVRQVVLRYGKTDEKWKVFSFRTIFFGDKPVVVFLDIVIKRVVRMYRDIDPEAARKIADHGYVDNITTDGSKRK